MIQKLQRIGEKENFKAFELIECDLTWVNLWSIWKYSIEGNQCTEKKWGKLARGAANQENTSQG